MPHPLVMALFRAGFNPSPAARAVRALGVTEDQLSVVTRDHRSQGEVAHELGGSPGAEIEDSRAAGMLGELSAEILAAMAIVMPGIGPIVVAGPLAAELGEAAGHAVGDLRSVLAKAGLDEVRASDWEENIRQGAVMFGVHVSTVDPKRVEKVLRENGATDVATTLWER
jgi:hypothetical protein